MAAGKSIIPATAKSSSGKISVCSAPEDATARSSADPGTADAWATNAPPPESEVRSATSSTLRVAPSFNEYDAWPSSVVVNGERV